MSDAKANGPVVGTTTKTGQYLEEPARLTWTTQKPTAPALYGVSEISRREGLRG